MPRHFHRLTGSLCLWLSGDCQVESGVRLLAGIAPFHQPKVWLRGFEVPRSCGWNVGTETCVRLERS